MESKEEPRIPHWQPFDCEACNAYFDPETWKSDWSISGELTWICPKCGHPNYPSLN
jgi:rubredoxin